MQTRSFFQAGKLSLKHLKGKKTTEMSKLSQLPPHIFSLTVLFTININYIFILSNYTSKHLNKVYLLTNPVVLIFAVNAPPPLCLGN